ncbi:DnaD domain-containing protein [Streptococcus sp. DD13]|uniref:DnaD domain-containing protein n=1 Tax=Streptococcus sp. DD13 TaxID=1777881 RepID=UPI00079BA49E|nr:DnaD domain-containing protein [Streptococcus sp. DD13]KXT79132.1 Chromosome replication initiation protein dnaD [Streptococcus sp. DD13]
MNYSQLFKSGHLVIPSALLFHFKELFSSADDFLVWQFFLFQNTSKLDDVMPSQIAESIGKSKLQVEQSIDRLQIAGLLELKTIELAGEVDMIFDVTPTFEKLDQLANPEASPQSVVSKDTTLKSLVGDFERELGRMLSGFEIEDLQKTIQEDHTPVELVREALREAVFNNKTNWKYIQAILRNWRREGITSLAQVEAKREERDAMNRLPQQVTASDEFLGAMNLWKD